MSGRDLVVREVQRVELLEAVRDQLQRVHLVVLDVELLEVGEVHQVVHVDLVVRDVEVGQVFEVLEILLGDLDDVHARQLGPDGLVGELDSARVEQEETVKDALSFLLARDAVLHLLRVDLPLPLRAVGYLLIVLHLGLLLLDLDHAVEVRCCHGQHVHIVTPIRWTLVLAGARDPSLASIVLLRWLRVRVLAVRSLEVGSSDIVVKRHIVVVDCVGRVRVGLLVRAVVHLVHRILRLVASV